jgi:hypothetical protein
LGWSRKRWIDFLDRKTLSICGILPLNKEDIIFFLKILSEFLRNNADLILNLSLILSCILLYINIPKVISMLLVENIDKEEKKERWIKIFKRLFWFFFFFLVLFFFYDYFYPEINTDLLNSTSYFSRRTLKFSLAMVLNISNFYINYKSFGLKSWRTYLSIFSIMSTMFIASVFYSDKFSNSIKILFIKIIELVTSLWLLFVYILEHKPQLRMLLMGPIFNDNNIIKEVKIEFGPLKVVNSDSDEEIFRNYKRQKSPYKKDIGEGDEKRFKRKQLSWYPPTKPYDPKDPRSPYHPYHLLYRHTDYQGLWRDRYKYRFGKLINVKFSETYHDITDKEDLPHADKNSAKFAEETLEPVIRKKHKDYKPTHPDWIQNTPNYKQWQKTKWGEKYPRMIAKDVINDSYLQDNDKSKPKRKLIYKKLARHKIIFPFHKSKEILINNHPLNKWSNYVKVKIKNDLYITKPESIERNKKEGKYQWERNTVKIRRTSSINTNFENRNQNENQGNNICQNEKLRKVSKEVVYIDCMESESKYKSVYVDIDQKTGRVFLKEMPIENGKRKDELEKRKYNLEKLVKFKKINGNICRIKINYSDTPVPWYRDKKALWFKNIFRSGYEGRERPDYIDLPLSSDGTLIIFDPNRFNFKSEEDKIEAGNKVKEALTNYNGVESIKSILDNNLKNDEYTSKQIKKNMKKNKPILMVEERHLPKQSAKEKIKSFFKNHTTGLFKGKPNNIKEIIDSEEQDNYSKGKDKNKSKVKLENKKLELLAKKQDLESKVNKIEERMTPPLLRESESDLNTDSDSDTNSNSDIGSNFYQVFWDENLVELKKKSKKLPLLPLSEYKCKNKVLPLFEDIERKKWYPWIEEDFKNKPLPLTPIEKEKLKLIKPNSSIKAEREKKPLSINQIIESNIRVRRWMVGLPKEETLEELRDEDLPVLPYRSKNKNIINVQEYLSEKTDKELKNKKSSEVVINEDKIETENINEKDIVRNKSTIVNNIKQVENIIGNDINQNEGVKKENIVQVEKTKDENKVQKSKAKEKELDTEAKRQAEKERKPNFNLFNKEYDEMFPPLRPEDHNWQESWNTRSTQEEKEAAFQAYYTRNADYFIRSNYNPIYPEPRDISPVIGDISSSLTENAMGSVIEKSGSSSISEENNSNQLSMWERRFNQKWDYIIKRFYYENSRLYEPVEKQYARAHPGLFFPDSIRDMMNDCNAVDRKEKDAELAFLKREAKREREAIIKYRTDLMRHGINPDVFNYWRNDLVIENICSVIMDKVQNGIDYKVELLDEEAKFLRHNTINRVEVASAWERVFKGGKTEEKLGDAYYQEVARLEAIPKERVLLIDLKARILTYKLEIFRHQLLREIKQPTIEAADSMEENRITWIEDIVKDPKKQAEVYNHALDYIKRVKNNENARWCRTAAPIHMEWAEYYLSRQKPGTLDFNLFDPENPDKFTVDMIDRFLKQDYDILELEMRKEQEKLEREKWRQENPTEVRKEYQRLLTETEKLYEAFKEEQGKLDEEEKLAKQKEIKRREEREKRGDDDIYF